MARHDVEVAVIGAGIVGIATAYYLAVHHHRTRVLVLDIGQPMTLTSAQSGENYRNWWPHPTMTAFTDHSIGLMEDIARRTGNRIAMTRRGYLLATRSANHDDLLAQLSFGYGAASAASIRVHEGERAATYQPPHGAAWQTAPSGVDVLLGRDLIGRQFAAFDPEIAAILHIRRAGDISGQQLGQVMLEEIRSLGGRFQRARVTAITRGSRFTLETDADGDRGIVTADRIVNAAGPFAPHVAALHGETLPITSVLQQKVTFPDSHGAVPRRLPFAIDLDGQSIAWTEEERAELAADPGLAPLLGPMPGGIHCRPDGGEQGQWIKLGWACNATPSEPSREPVLDLNFPEVVLRAASRLQPALRPYVAALPRTRVHYGGFYAMTAENWPLIGPAMTPGVFLATALSGYGTMAACAAGDLCARAIAGASLPAFAEPLSLCRYQDRDLMAELASLQSRGVL